MKGLVNMIQMIYLTKSELLIVLINQIMINGIFPQLDTDEKTGPKVLNNLAAAVNAEYLSALLKMQLIQSQKSKQDLIIVPIYVHPE